MTSMHVADLMTSKVVSVAPEATLKEVADLLVEHRISGVPVCDADGCLLGVVSESDILWKELRALPGGGGFVSRLFESAYGDDKRVGARTAGEAMSSPPVTVPPDAPLARAARLMISYEINRLPVVDGGRLVGILARSDLVRAYQRTDQEVKREIRDDVLRRDLCVDPDSLSLAVTAGEVVIAGEVENRSIARAIEQHVRAVPGVAAVRSELRWQVDDRAHRTAAAADRLTPRI